MFAQGRLPGGAGEPGKLLVIHVVYLLAVLAACLAVALAAASGSGRRYSSGLGPRRQAIIKKVTATINSGMVSAWPFDIQSKYRRNPDRARARIRQ